MRVRKLGKKEIGIFNFETWGSLAIVCVRRLYVLCRKKLEQTFTIFHIADMPLILTR